MEQYNRPTDAFLQEPTAYGSFWERVGAALIDGIIVSVIGVVVGLIAGQSRTVYSGSSFYVTYFSTSNLINLVVGWLYYAFQESSASQATIGKRALGLKVTSLNGERISFGQATGRHFGKWLSAIILFIGFLMMLWDDKKQTLHDKLAGTLVVKSKA